MSKLTRPQISISKLILVTAGIFTLLYNLAFFRNTYDVYASEPGGLLFIASLAVFLFAVIVLVLSALCFRFFTKPVLITTILAAAAGNYFMNSFNIVLDTTMITNVLETDTSEASDLITLALVIEFIVLGIFPSLLIWRTRITCRSLPVEILQRIKLGGASLILIVLSVLPFTAYYTSFFREHKILRYYANPATVIYSAGKTLNMAMAAHDSGQRSPIGLDAHIPEIDVDRELIILVVGEAARADHFGLNGYDRDTTPLLAKENIISYSNLYSCGTATAYSLPCMFSLAERTDFELDEAKANENLLDVLAHAGVGVLWRDNNSDSKGVAQAVEFEDFRQPHESHGCDEECRDVSMLAGLDDYIASKSDGDIVIVLHQMGNHGPAYYKRYPPEFEQFVPACHSVQLETCTPEEIVNAYDNAILYTDYFLSETISFLENYDDRFETAMYYMSDHGESLGENGLYLHGMPWLFAPDNQKHVASLLWLGDNFHADRDTMASFSDVPLSHDNFFHTVLSLMEVQSDVYDPRLDLVVHTSAPGQNPSL